MRTEHRKRNRSASSSIELERVWVTSMFTRTILLIVGLLLLSLVSRLAGQAISGNVIGTVTDPSGSVVSEAQVVITNVATNASQQATTNDSGNYVAADL